MVALACKFIVNLDDGLVGLTLSHFLPCLMANVAV